MSVTDPLRFAPLNSATDGVFVMASSREVIVLASTLPSVGVRLFAHRGTRVLFSRKPLATLAPEDLRETHLDYSAPHAAVGRWAVVVLFIFSELNLIDLSWLPARGTHSPEE